MMSVVHIDGKGAVQEVQPSGSGIPPGLEEADAKVALIQALIPLGLAPVHEALAAEVTRLARPKWSRAGGQPGVVRWTMQPRLVYLLHQKVPIAHQRVRDVRRAAYQRPTYAGAKAALLRVRQDLKTVNESAVKSLDEGFEETLTLHRLGLFPQLGPSLKTTTWSRIDQRPGRAADRARDRVAHGRPEAPLGRRAALLEIEPRLRQIKGHRALPLLRVALQREITTKGSEAA